MKLLSSLLTLYQSFHSLTSGVASNHTVVDFDDIPTPKGLANVSSPYHNLRFNLYSVFKPDDPALNGIISERDLNCAVSSPNALVGSRLSENGNGASFEISNKTAMTEERLQPYFTLHSLYIKPMDAPAPGTTVYVKGYSKARREPLLWHVFFPSGYHIPFLVKLEEYTGEAWSEINKVEITADFGYDALDWEFCIDELKLQFFESPKIDDTAEQGRHSIQGYVEEI